MRDDAVLRRALPLGRGLGRITLIAPADEAYYLLIDPLNQQCHKNLIAVLFSNM